MNKVNSAIEVPFTDQELRWIYALSRIKRDLRMKQPRHRDRKGAALLGGLLALKRQLTALASH